VKAVTKGVNIEFIPLIINEMRSSSSRGLPTADNSSANCLA
jgi:hypothetical protein